MHDSLGLLLKNFYKLYLLKVIKIEKICTSEIKISKVIYQFLLFKVKIDILPLAQIFSIYYF